MPDNGYFSCERDRAMIEAGGFLCHACLVSKPAIEQSPDGRYCRGCYEFILKEAEMLTGHERADWRPKVAATRRESEAEPAVPISEHGGGIMSTLKGEKIEVDIIDPADTTTAIVKGKRGPKHRALPEGLIIQLMSEGMGSKAIAARLKSELGIKVSYKTIQRRALAKEKIRHRELLTEGVHSVKGRHKRD